MFFFVSLYFRHNPIHKYNCPLKLVRDLASCVPTPCPECFSSDELIHVLAVFMYHEASIISLIVTAAAIVYPVDETSHNESRIIL